MGRSKGFRTHTAAFLTLNKETVMSPPHRATKSVLAVALALVAVAPVGAQARPITNAWPPNSQRDLDALARTTSSSARVLTVTAPGGIDWGDAGIGAGAGLGLALAGVGTGLVIGDKRRHRRRPAIR